MNELIKTIKTDNGTVAVDGRALHEFLEVDTPYKDWFPRMVEYGFVENVDFIGLAQKSAKPQGGRPQLNHALSLDMAKELSMIQRSDKGRQARQYFIQMEKLVLLPQTPEEKIEVLLQNSGNTNEKIKLVDKRVTALEDDQSLDPGEYNFLNKEVSKAVTNFIRDRHMVLNQAQRSKLYRDISVGLNEVTGVRTRTQLRKKNYDAACDFVAAWTPSVATLTVIQQLSEQAV